MTTTDQSAATVAAREKIGTGMKIGYGAGDFAANIVFQTVTLFLLYFYTDVFMLGASTAGIIAGFGLDVIGYAPNAAAASDLARRVARA